MSYKSPLRDLASKLSRVAREHIAYSQAAEAISHINSYLCALARCEEANRQQEELVVERRVEADRREASTRIRKPARHVV